jgi:hypothetical protein
LKVVAVSLPGHGYFAESIKKGSEGKIVLPKKYKAPTIVHKTINM